MLVLGDAEPFDRIRRDFAPATVALGIPFHVETEAIPTDPDWNEGGHPVVRVARAEIAALMRRGRRFIVF